MTNQRLNTLVSQFEHQLMVTKFLEMETYTNWCDGECSDSPIMTRTRNAAIAAQKTLSTLRELLILEFGDEPIVDHLCNQPCGHCVSHDCCKKITEAGNELNFWN